MKRVSNLYKSIAEPENLRLAFWKAQRGKTGKAEVCSFRHNLNKNLAEMRRQLLNHEVRIGDYHYFTIYDPKERRICAASFPERVLHHAIMNMCEPVFERYQIHDSYASRKGKGTYAALERARCFTRRYRWFLKLDVRKYFDSIDHQVLKRLLGRLFKDREVLDLFDRIIESYAVSEGRGVPIGNLTSQYFANHFLGTVDHLVKECLRTAGYVRYMDDMVLWHNDRQTLLKAGRSIRMFITEHLQMDLKPDCMNDGGHGLPFLGYLVFPEQVKLARRSRRRFQRRMLLARESLLSGLWDQTNFSLHVLPAIAYTQYAHARGFRRKIVNNLWVPSEGSNRVNRGGSWNNSASNCRVANRNNNAPTNTNNNIGFRVALAPPAQRNGRMSSTEQDGIPSPLSSGANSRASGPGRTGLVGEPEGQVRSIITKKGLTRRHEDHKGTIDIKNFVIFVSLCENKKQ